MNRNSFLYTVILSFLFCLISCQDDDVDLPAAQGRDVQMQANLDDRKLKSFLEQHAFNDLEFQNSNNFTHRDIEFITIKDTLGVTIPLTTEQTTRFSGQALIDSPLLKSIPNLQFAGVNHTAYYLMLVEGEGKPVTNVDPVFTSNTIQFVGNESESFIDKDNVIGRTIDDRIAPIWSNPFNGNFGFTDVAGFREVVSKFKTAIPVSKPAVDTISNKSRKLLKQCQVFSTNETFDAFNDSSGYGVGVAFLPSGLAVFQEDQNNANGFRTFQNLIYSFTLFNTDYNDRDRDGIPSLLEMTDADGNINPNIDTDNDGVPDYLDTDDDNDERATLLEIEITDSSNEIDSNCDGIFTNDSDVKFLDANKNGVPDHLDSSIRFGF